MSKKTIRPNLSQEQTARLNGYSIDSLIARLITVCELESIRFAIKALVELNQNFDDPETINVVKIHVNNLFTVMTLVQHILVTNAIHDPQDT